MRPLTTFSIVGRCERTGQLGVAVSTADVAAGRLVTWARAGVGAVATQSWPSLYLAIDALDELERGASAPEALELVLANDPGRSVRQLGVVDARGGSASFSGHECTTWFGEATGPNFAAQGNMLINDETVSAMAEAFARSADLDLAERLMVALEAGQAAAATSAAGSAPRCSWSIGRHTRSGTCGPTSTQSRWPSRRRIFEIAKLDLLPFVEGLPMRENPLGSRPKSSSR